MLSGIWTSCVDVKPITPLRVDSKFHKDVPFLITDFINSRFRGHG